MPLPTNAKIVETSQSLVDTLHAIYGPHPGFRPAHAKGILLTGNFSPTAAAAELSKAPHFTRPSTPVIARFSNAGGIPNLPDTDPTGLPRGFAVRFELETSPVRQHTDVVANSVDAFPATTGEETLEFFNAIRDGKLEDYVESHPKAVPFVQAPRPFPAAFGREKYHSVNAFKFVSRSGKETYFRYKILPAAGEAYLSDAELKGKSNDFLFDGVAETLKSTGPIVFKLAAQIAQEGDVTDDNTMKWPEDRQVVELGTLCLESIMENQAPEQKRIIFDPIPRVDGIEPSADPLLDLRAGVYLLSGRERRAA
ncbi:catalase related protein [Hypoxylon crocopeplum]|nr:catalase related protein [Hypoxylon crocopeplum]